MATSGQIVAKDAYITLEYDGAARNVSGDTNSATLSRTVETPDVTAFGDTSRARITGGLKDWNVSATTFFNDSASTGIQTVIANLLGSQTMMVFAPAGSASGYVKYTGCGIVSEYSIESAVDGVVGLSYTLVASAGSLSASTM